MITLFPDFFIDVIVKFKYPKNIFIEKLSRKIQGNIDVSEALVKYGGNATNTSITLGMLGIKNNLIVLTNNLGRIILNKIARNLPIDIYIIESSICFTVSFEFSDKIMISYPKCLQRLDPEILLNKYASIFERSKYIVFGGWNHVRYSNEIIEKLYEIKKGKLYLDIGDPSHKTQELRILGKYLEKGYVDILSLNEHELLSLARLYRIEKGNLIETAKELFKLFNLEYLDLHTPEFAYTLPDDVMVKAFEIKKENIVCLTGAGDAWNAGNIYGYIHNMLPENRLYFAHITAKRYITGELLITL